MEKIHILGASVFFAFNIYSQDQVLINPGQALLALNPSYAGSNNSVRNQFVYLNQWPNLSANNITYYNGLDAYVNALHGGLALSVLMNDQANGTYKNTALNLVYAPQFECKEVGLKVIPSIQASYLQNQVDVSGLSFGQIIQGTQLGVMPSSGTKRSVDFSGGLLVNYKNFYAGGTVFHINQPDVGVLSASELPARFNFNASYNLPLNEKNLIHFSAVYSRQQKYSGCQLAINAILLKHIVAGLGYMSSETPFINLGYRNNYFSVTACYAVVYSKLAGNTAGSTQLTLGLRLPKKTPTTTPDNFEKW